MTTVHFQHIRTSMVGEVAVVEVLPTELRFPAQAQELGQELMLVASQDWAKQLLINLANVKFLSSTGFAVLVNVLKESSKRGHDTRFCAVDPEVMIGAEIIGLTKLAAMHATEQEGLDSFQRAS